MSRHATLPAFAIFLLASAFAAGCAAPGDPTARHPVVPLAVSDLAARQSGNAFALSFTLPARSTDREDLAERPAVEIYRAELPPGSTPDKKTVWRLAYAIPSERVDAYLKGAQIEFQDALSADDLARPAGSMLAYKIRTRAAKTRESADSNIVTAPIYPAPETPREVRVEIMESALAIHWAEVAVPAEASSLAYRVYRETTESGQVNPVHNGSEAKPATPPELAGTSTSTEFRDAHFEFGSSYRYTVRSVAQFGADFVESADSAPVAVTPRDVFPPAAPTGVEITVVPATPEAAAYVELSWAISPEGDLAGYFVYRGSAEDAPGERVSTEILPSPEFRDMSVQPGKTYYYRVAAVDRAGNESPKSSAVHADVP